MYTFIFDIGKTNIKGHVLDASGESIWSKSMRNTPNTQSEYPSIEVGETWEWLKSALSEAYQTYPFSAINISTHGACAILLNKDGELALPVMDYEVESLDIEGKDYLDIRPSYEETLSPALSGGLNLGRQLWWLKESYPEEFSKVETVLFYPQYWVWKLTGVAVAEATSLGCHTDLWLPQEGKYSSLVDTLGLRDAFPPVVSCSEAAATLSNELAETLNIPADCKVFPGVHDSNSGLARYLASDLDAPFNVVSTGTWVVTLAVGGDCTDLKDENDMLANVDVRGVPVACARFMGGREFQLITEATNASDDEQISQTAIQELINQRAMAIPPFDTGSGPFRNGPNKEGRFIGDQSRGKSLATLYLALMIDCELELLGTEGPILFGSTSTKNPELCRLIAQLRPNQTVLMSGDAASTIKGAWCLTRWNDAMPASLSEFTTADSMQLEGLAEYKAEWRKHAGFPVNS